VAADLGSIEKLALRSEHARYSISNPSSNFYMWYVSTGITFPFTGKLKSLKGVS